MFYVSEQILGDGSKVYDACATLEQPSDVMRIALHCTSFAAAEAICTNLNDVNLCIGATIDQI